ncbi:MAG: YdbH domain-containing protein, partial [Pseudomonadota bacterium]
MLALVVFAGLAGGLTWVFRVPIADVLVQRACQDRGLSCQFEIETLGTEQVVFSGLSVRARPGTAPLAADRLEVDLVWTGWRPGVAAVRADGAEIAARFDGSRLEFGGLEDALGGGAGGASALPQVTAEGGTLNLLTPAGTVSGSFDLQVNSRSDARLRATLSPAQLSTAEADFDLSETELDLTLQGGRIAGVADIHLVSGTFDGFRAEEVVLRAEIAPDGQRNGDALVYRLAAQSLSSGQIDLQAATSTGTLLLEPGTLTRDDPLGGLILVSGTLEADRLRAPGLSADGLEVDLDLARSGAGDVKGPIAVQARATRVDGVADTGEMALSGTLGYGETRVRFDGQVTAAGIDLDAAQIARLDAVFEWPGTFAGHGEALREALSRALGDFETGARLRASRRSDGAMDIAVSGPVRVSAATGLTLAVQPFGEGAWLELGGDGASLRGSVALSGGGAPDLTAQVNEMSLSGGTMSVRLGETDLSDWREGAVSLGAGLTRLEVSRGPDRLAVSGQGDVRFDGPMAGVTYRDLSLFGAVDAVRGGEGWRAQLGGGRCLSLAFQSLALQAVELGSVTTSLCPEDGRIVRQSGDGSSGTLQLDAISAPVSIGSSQGQLSLPESTLDWSLGRGVRAELLLDRMALDLQTGPRELGLVSGDSRVAIETGSGSGAQVTGRLRDVDFDGSLIPANASADRFDFGFSSGQGGLTGSADIAGVRVTDVRDDPLYQPVIADLSAQLLRGEVRLIGPVRLEASGREVGDADIRVAFPSVDGMITITGRDLQFRPGGLQPTDLSERLRGLFTDTRGQLEAEARIAISRGNLSGTGDLTVRDLSFQTIALGRVRGVNGGVFFSDLLKLQSPPRQSITIAEIDPGIALEDGQVAFQMTGNGSAALERAVWPFAGGALSVEPTRWEIGAPRRRLTVRADRIGLAELTDLLQLPGFNAEGTVSGRFPIVFQAGEVLIDNARLLATDEGGVLRYTGDIGQRAGEANESVKTAFQALENFEFTVLELGANGDLLDVVIVTARLEGRNPDMLGASPFNFNVSVESQLGQLLTTARRLSG